MVVLLYSSNGHHVVGPSRMSYVYVSDGGSIYEKEKHRRLSRNTCLAHRRSVIHDS